MALIVVESPTKARTFNRILKSKPWGKDYFVFATVGHFRDLPASKMAVDFKNHFAPDYEIMEKKLAMVTKLKDLATEHKRVILATDLDREGESISYHVAYILGYIDENWPDFTILNNDKLDRIVFHEITPKALEEALQAPEKLREDLVKAQQTRRILDRVVGYQLSPLLWKKMGKNWLSAGRVQTVALRIIVEREKEILSFPKNGFYLVNGNFEHTPSIRAQLIAKNDIPYETKKKIQLFDGKYEYTTSSIVKENVGEIEKDLKNDSFEIKDIKVEKSVKYPPPPYSTSLLQQDAFQKYGFPSKFTMRIAQTLYEKGLITYHRTDSFNLSAKFVFPAKEYIAKKYGPEYALDKPRGFKNRSKNAQEAHEAIRPTKVDRSPTSLPTKKYSVEERKLYKLIFNRALATQMKEASIKTKKVMIQSQKGYQFETSYVQVLFDGFMKVLMPEYVEKHLSEVQISSEKVTKLVNLEIEEKMVRPPYRYNEASLIRTLEQKGIGRPSTYASIISVIVDKHYTERERRYLKPTPLGNAISDYLSVSFPDIFDLKFTAEMEDKLDDIAGGGTKPLELLESFYKSFETELKVQNKATETIEVIEESLAEPCPKCGGKVIARFGKFGKFFACNNYPKCKYTKPNLRYVNGYFCPLCKGRLVSRNSKTGKRFFGCENYPECKHVQWALKIPVKVEKVEGKIKAKI